MLWTLFADASDEFMEWIQYPPGSMVFVLMLSLIVAIIITTLNKLLVDDFFYYTIFRFSLFFLC